MFAGRIGLYMGAAGAVLALVGFLWWQNHRLTAEIKILAANNGKLQSAVAVQHETINGLQEIMRHTAEAQTQLNEKFAESERKANELQETLRAYRNDRLNNAALARPKLVERRLNSGAVDVMCAINKASGGQSRSCKDR